MLRKTLLVCGILSSMLYAAMMVVVAQQWPGYSSASQTISELSAIGAPTRSLWLVARRRLHRARDRLRLGRLEIGRSTSVSLRISGGLILGYGSLGLLWPFAPMHLRDALAAGGSTLSDTLHIALSSVTVLLMFFAIGFGGAAFGKRFRAYSAATLVILLTFGVLTFFDAPRVAANLPTPWIGVWERVNVGVFLLWIVVLAIVLLRREERAAEIGRGAASAPPRVDGQVSRGFEPVREAFVDNFARRHELGGACCAYPPWRDRRRSLGRQQKQADRRALGAEHDGGRPLRHQRAGCDDARRRPLAWMARLRGTRLRVLAGVRAARQGAHHRTPAPGTPGRTVRHQRTSRPEHRRRSRSPGRGAGAPEARVGTWHAAGVPRADARVLRGRAVAAGRPEAPQPRTILPGRDRIAAWPGPVSPFA